jgi:pyruvate formate lyase activating enzyme
MMKEAMLYTKLKDDLVRCQLCAHRCTIKPHRVGICGVRRNEEGTLYTMVYAKAVAVHVDPIEKKPLYHFLPGSASFSIATIGCNFRCLFCQNADISQASKGGRWGYPVRDFPPEEVVAEAKRYKCASIAYTYTEPTIFFEYAYDTALLAHQQGIKNIFVTNGYMTEEALEAMGPYLDAANVDLKSFNPQFYRRIVGARLEPVLETIERMHEMGVWVEVTTLVIPGQNDGEEELREIARFIAGIDVDMPWHISRFVPNHKMRSTPFTPVETIHRAAEIGHEEGLHYVYAGNVPGDPHENSYCPHCSQIVIRRLGYHIHSELKGRACPSCGEELAFILN